jgi:hypothetical protein
LGLKCPWGPDLILPKRPPPRGERRPEAGSQVQRKPLSRAPGDLVCPLSLAKSLIVGLGSAGVCGSTQIRS